MKQYLKLHIFSEKEKQKVIEQLNKQFGIEKLDGILVKRGADRIFLFKGDLSVDEVNQLDYARVNLERVGIYFAKYVNDEIRLSIEGVYLLRKQIKKNIFELNDEQVELWLQGQDLFIEHNENGFVVVKYKNDFLGCGKASREKIGNFVPKNRRLKIK